jgi:hypothetical protein
LFAEVLELADRLVSEASVDYVWVQVPSSAFYIDRTINLAYCAKRLFEPLTERQESRI